MLLLLDKISNLIWGPGLLLLVLGSGTFLTTATGFFPIRKILFICKNTFGSIVKNKAAFFATATALGATVGTGNIVGVAAAIAIGGAGSVFWMWIGALLGMMIKFAESSLAVKYCGGAPVYIKKAFGGKASPLFWCVCCVLASFGGGNMVQSNSAAGIISASFGIPAVVTGITLALLTAVVIFGGAKTVTKTSGFLVPVMAIIYVIGCLAVIFVNFENIPAALEKIFSEAFTPLAAGGGISGLLTSKALQVGITKGTFTHEAGMGSASLAHAESEGTSPAFQGCWGIIEVFIDTIFVCSLTALVILCREESEVWNIFHNAFSWAGDIFLSVSMFLFALAAIIGWAFYGEKSLKYITKSNLATNLYRICFCVAVVIGSVSALPAIWNITDIFNGLMIFPNIIAILFLWKEIREITCCR